MKKYSICIVGVYFGKLPKYFNLWLKSCENNSDIDFLIIGDGEGIADEIVEVYKKNKKKTKN